MRYRDAGVDTRKGADLVERIKGYAAATEKPGGGANGSGVLSGLGGFGALYQLGDYRQPVLVSGTDGVGTKLHLAVQAKDFKNVGIDCVAMCVNDILCHGARPLFFLDYLAYADMAAEGLAEVVEGVADGCSRCGCALVGGETAQLPGIYHRGDFDIAGFAVGVVERKQLVDGSKIEEGDVLLGLASSGLHSNGFSLVRALLSSRGIDLFMDFNGRPLIEELLTPTRIYTDAVLSLCEKGLVRGMAHITGGGLYENVPRMFSGSHAEVGAVLRRGSWREPPIFKFIEELDVDRDEMMHTFNMGIGFVVAVAPEQQDRVVRSLVADGITVFEIGRVNGGAGVCFE